MSVASELLATLQAVDATIPVGDGKAPDGLRYAVLWAGEGLLSAQDVAHTSDLLSLDFQITSVGRGTPEARWIARRLRDAIVDRVLTVPGWQLGPIVHDGSERPRDDNDRPDGVTVVFCIDRFHLSGARA